MTELLFGLTVVFFGYVLYEVYKTVSEPHGEVSPVMDRPLPVPKPSIDRPAVEEPEPAEAAAPVAAAPEPAAPAAKPEADRERGTHIRNPATGEVSAVPSNYRFAKKWIKEVLVAEGLLDRVYKPNELDAAASQKAKEALERLRGLDKYHP